MRNRQRLIDSAKAAFTEQGASVSLDTIAQHAGVGIGTLYRHFSNRDALIEAVCRVEVEQLAAAAVKLLEEREPGEALLAWMQLYVDFIATNRLLASAVTSLLDNSAGDFRSSVAEITDNPVLGATTELYKSTTTLFLEASQTLLEAAEESGAIQTRIQSRDLLRALSGFTATYGDEIADWQANAKLLARIFYQGLTTAI